MGNLAAGCFRKRTRFQESDRVKLNAVNLRDSSANHAYQRFQRIRSRDIKLSRVELSRNGDTFVMRLKCKYGDTTGTDGRVLALNCQFEILRVVFVAAYDQKIFQASCNKQLAVDEHTEITRAQVGPLPSPASLAPKVCAVSSSRRQ